MKPAAQAGDGHMQFLATLRRARGRTLGALPLTLDLCDARTFTACSLGGWSFAEAAGTWTDGPLSQLLIVPDTPPSGDIAVTLEVGEVLLNPRNPTQSVAVDINGAAFACWAFGAPPEAASRRIVVPGSAAAGLGAFLVTLRVARPQPLRSLGIPDKRAPGVALRKIHLQQFASP